MGAAKKFSDKKALQSLVPFNALAPGHFEEVCRKTHIEVIRAGRYLFREGDRDNKSVYVLDGDVNLVSGKEVVGNIAGGSESARHPIAHRQPRQVAARARSNCTIARVDTSILDVFLTWDQSTGYEVNEIEKEQDGDWMTRMLQSRAFRKLPPANIQRLLMSAESIPAKAGDVIIRQGGEGKYFYIIKSGSCVVTRRASSSGSEIKLAELSDGDVFGEEALVSDEKRNASVTMSTDGTLMRLAKDDFIELFKEPLIEKVTYEEAARLDPLNTEWIDVRLPGEFENSSIPGTRNIPLSALRAEAESLDRNTKYVVCCDTGRRSASAAFILSQRGLDVYLLLDGLSQVPASELTGDLKISRSPAAMATSAEVFKLEAAQNDARQKNPGKSVGESGIAQPAVAQAEFDQTFQELGEALTRSEMLEENLEAVQLELKAIKDRHQKEMSEMRATVREQTLELEQTAQEARDEARQSQATASGLREQLKQLELAGKSRNDELDQSQGQVQQLEEDLEQLGRALEEEKRRAGEMKQEYESRIMAGESEREAAGGTAADTQAHLQAELEETRQERDRHKALVSDLEQRLSTLVADAEKTRVGHQRVRESLESERDVARVQQDQLRDAHEKQLTELQSRHAARESELTSTIQDLEGALEDQRRQAGETGMDRDRQISDLAARLEQGTGELRETVLAMDALRAERDGLATDLQAMRARSGGQEEQHDARIAEIQHQLSATEEQLLEASNETLSLRNQLAESEQDRLRAREELAKLAGELEHALEAETDAQVVALNTQLEELREEHAQSHDALVRENEELRNQLATQATSVAADEQERQRLEAEISHMTGELRAAADKQVELDEQIAAMTAREEDDRKAMLNIEEREVQLDEQVAALTRELEQVRHDQDQVLQAAVQESDRFRMDLETALRERNALEHSLEQAEQRVLEVESALAVARREAGDRQTDDADLEAQVSTLKNRISTLQAERSSSEETIAALEKDLDVSRAALSREQRRVEGYKTRLEESLDTVGQASAAEIEQLHAALDEAESRSSQAEREADRLQQALAETTAKKTEEHAALSAELGRLREVTTADIEATHQEVQRLRQELEIARQANAREADEGEIERLRFLLEETRDQLATYQAGSGDGSLMISALPEAIEEAVGNGDRDREMQSLQEALAAATRRVDEMTRLHDDARADSEQLRQELEIANTKVKLAATTGPAPGAREKDFAIPDLDPAYEQRQGGVMRGIMFGLALGVAGVAGFLWFDARQDAAEPAVAENAPPLATETVEVPELAEPVPAAALPGGHEAEEMPPNDIPVDETAAVVESPVTVAEEPPLAPLPVAKAVREFRDKLVDYGPGPLMVELTGGEFLMGSGSSSLDSDEQPRHAVSVPAFAVSRYEVTFEDYDTFADDTGRSRPDDEGWGRGNRPVINVSWYDAAAYAEWLSEQTGKRYRLPTESEWEFMAGANSRSLYWWGTSIGTGNANCFNCGSEWDSDRSAPTGSFVPNAFGIHDTAGNVHEWVQDCYLDNYDYAREDGSAWIEPGCDRRVTRGGGFDSAANTLRTTKRSRQLPGSRGKTLGFRLARDL